jgi:hypothetical protein
MKEDGVDFPNSVLSDACILRSTLFKIETAVEQPYVALLLSNLKISAISYAVR